MKYKSKSELGNMISELQGSVAVIRKANEKLRRDFKNLDGPDGRKYTDAERLALKGQLRSDAAATLHRDFIGLRKTIQRETEFWESEFFAAVPLHFPNSIADEMTERLWLSEKYKLLSPLRFIEAVKQASEDGRAAELHIARLVVESRSWRNVEEQQDVSTALHFAERDCAYSERSESLELLSVAAGLLEDATSAYKSISEGTQDVRLKMQQSVDQRLKNISDTQKSREQLAKDHGIAFQL